MKIHHTQPISLCCLVLLSAAFLGCQSPQSANWDLRRTLGLKSDKPEPPQMPTRVVSTWTDTILHQKGEKSQRGFGGRLSFFARESDEPVRVEGQLVVYAFDEANRAAHESHPTRRYVFPVEQFARHESDSQLGPSYSVWLPWGAVGGKQKNISLIVRFEPSEGPILMGEQTNHLLPGAYLAENGTQTSPSLIQDTRIETAQYRPTVTTSLTKINAKPDAKTTKADQQSTKRMEVTAIQLPEKK